MLLLTRCARSAAIKAGRNTVTEFVKPPTIMLPVIKRNLGRVSFGHILPIAKTKYIKILHLFFSLNMERSRYFDYVYLEIFWCFICVF